MPDMHADMVRAVRKLAREGKPIDAIKLIRDQGFTLGEASRWYEGFLQGLYYTKNNPTED